MNGTIGALASDYAALIRPTFIQDCIGRNKRSALRRMGVDGTENGCCICGASGKAVTRSRQLLSAECSYRGDNADFDLVFWRRECRFDAGTGRRILLRDPTIPYGVHVVEVLYVGEPDRCHQDFRFICAGFTEVAVNLVENLTGLVSP